ncbi:hypothetical protein VC83_02175 [Pseudogymnoascus destructans]|uniref:Rhodopsin domain-containing protein n=2 Tax=Pseudogymnoascus destructans TaxID=655981 RepID=L8FTY0_PSED2|nr:uncharacterized protein VC83_02175 [Pseudogymnoascus destructans]ELR04425.1 hypothetical protein GMDG_01501 [Pseudogymnoascus destructans 20631-21]OAF61544.1 hypothetical protein VC83_02175 [Pseudogymnoascus destructans]
MTAFWTAPPPARTFNDDKATLIVCWWCTIFAITIIVFRVTGRYLRTEKLFPEDIIAFLCIIPILARMAMVHVVLLWGTNNVITDGLSQQNISHREIGSRLVLGSRIFYAASLWMLKLSIAEFLKRFTQNIWRSTHELVLRLMYYYLGATMIAVLIADLAECHPVTHYWQVVPDPGPECRQGYAQLITMAVANVTTDLLLVIFPIPLIFNSHMPLPRKTMLTILFGLSLIPIGITLCRAHYVIHHQGAQHHRSLWASIEILFATAVANALVIGSFVRDKGVKKHKYKLGSSGSMERTLSSRRGRGYGPGAVAYWGSDEELVRGLGIGVDADLRPDSGASIARPAPVAEPGAGVDRNWRFPSQRRSDVSDVETVRDSTTRQEYNFFDVGGLLGPESPPPANKRIGPSRRGSLAGPTPSWRGSTMVPPRWRSASPFDNFPAPVAAPRDDSADTGGTAVFLQDVGGLMEDAPRTASQVAQAGLARRASEGVLLRGWSFRRREEKGVEMQSLGGRDGEGRGTAVLGVQMASAPSSPQNGGANNSSPNAEAGRGIRRSREDGMDLNDVGGLLFVI